MRDVLAMISGWRSAGLPVAIATVVGVTRSAPRQPGAVMAISGDGEVAGSVSGGCVESAVVEEAHRVLETGEPALVTFGYSDDEAFAVGLTCGGEIQVFIERLDPTEPIS